ncbi:MAG: GDP-mannose 4,6-dehydratase, partial [Nitrososphaera sp.]|nr:GDP-mannose 4,6-dehydratase [Nitrososphaera sp.]
SQSGRFDIVTARPFTHIGPGQSDRFAVAHFAKQITEISTGGRAPVMDVGDLSATRDVTDVRDVVRAYKVLLNQGRNGEAYNVCSGIEVSTNWLLRKLIEYSGLEIEVRQEPSLVRKHEQRRIVGSYEKINNETKWTPLIPLRQTLCDTLAYWRSALE